MEYFPLNKTSNFVTKLPKVIKLEGQWAVSLVEFNYPCSMLTVQESENIISITKKRPSQGLQNLYTEDTKIHATNYDTIQNLISSLNLNTVIQNNNITFIYNDITKFVSVGIDNDAISVLKLSPKLCLQLGFEPNVNLVTNPISKYPVNLYLGLPSQIFIYCDICEPQIVGDVMTSLLRNVPLDSSKYLYGAYKMNIFSHPYYIPVLRREFDTMEIDIRTETGHQLPFEFGTACVKLHFKQINNN